MESLIAPWHTSVKTDSISFVKLRGPGGAPQELSQLPAAICYPPTEAYVRESQLIHLSRAAFHRSCRAAPPSIKPSKDLSAPVKGRGTPTAALGNGPDHNRQDLVCQ